MKVSYKISITNAKEGSYDNIPQVFDLKLNSNRNLLTFSEHLDAIMKLNYTIYDKDTSITLDAAFVEDLYGSYLWGGEYYAEKTGIQKSRLFSNVYLNNKIETNKNIRKGLFKFVVEQSKTDESNQEIHVSIIRPPWSKLISSNGIKINLLQSRKSYNIRNSDDDTIFQRNDQLYFISSYSLPRHYRFKEPLPYDLGYFLANRKNLFCCVKKHDIDDEFQLQIFKNGKLLSKDSRIHIWRYSSAIRTKVLIVTIINIYI